MKTICTVAVCVSLLLISSCTPKDQSCSYQVYIPFTELEIPDTILVNVPLHLYAVTETPDNCWDAYFNMNTVNLSEYTLQAVGYYECASECLPDVSEYDTTFIITPTQTGNLIIHIAESSNTTRNDTIYVK
jgi:hypothetical protein